MDQHQIVEAIKAEVVAISENVKSVEFKDIVHGVAHSTRLLQKCNTDQNLRKCNHHDGMLLHRCNTLSGIRKLTTLPQVPLTCLYHHGCLTVEPLIT